MARIDDSCQNCRSNVTLISSVCGVFMFGSTGASAPPRRVLNVPELLHAVVLAVVVQIVEVVLDVALAGRVRRREAVREVVVVAAVERLQHVLAVAGEPVADARRGRRRSCCLKNDAPRHCRRSIGKMRPPSPACERRGRVADLAACGCRPCSRRPDSRSGGRRSATRRLLNAQRSCAYSE